LKIAILHHKHTDLEKTPCLINYLAQNWIEQGHNVIHIKGVDSPLPAADVLILHVNLTVVPQEYIQAAERYPVVINRNVIDISKPAFSQIMVKQDDHYSGPVIVKTRNNYGGVPERRIRNSIIDKVYQQFEWLRLWQHVEWLIEYPVFKSVEKIPQGVWQNEHLFVEKFLPERDNNGNYRIREWVFFGDREVHFINISHEPVIKSMNKIRVEYSTPDEIPHELRRIRAAMGIDYGKFDFSVHHGSPVLFDINKTPGISSNSKNSTRAVESIRQLSNGLELYAQQIKTGCQ